jgi:cytochrome c oxidase subunit 2
MIGWVEVMEPTDYQMWLAGGTEGSLASQGEKLFQKYACSTCHTNDATGRGPVLIGLYGTNVTLTNDTTVVANEDYIRESILNPQAKIVKGFTGIMPTFQGQMSEDDLLKLVAYIHSLGTQKAAGAGPPGSASVPQPAGQSAVPTQQNKGTNP